MNAETKSQIDLIADRAQMLDNQIQASDASPEAISELTGERDYLLSLHTALTAVHVDLPALMQQPIHNRRCTETVY